MAASLAVLSLPLAALAQNFAVSTPAGAAGVPGNLNNSDGAQARFNKPTGLASDGTSIYVADQDNNVVRKVTISSGAVTTFASGFNGLSGVAVDGAGNVFVTDTGNNVIKRFNSSGALDLTIGTGTASLVNSTLALSTFNGPVGIGVFGSGGTAIVYVADQANNAIRRIDIAGNAVSTIVSGFQPWGLAINSGGTTLYVTDYSGGLIKSIAVPANTVTTLNGTYSIPRGVAVDASGNVYVADTGTQTIKKISSGVVTTVAGGAGIVGSTDGSGTNARFNNPFGVVATAVDSLYIGDASNHTIRRIVPATAPVFSSANNASFTPNVANSFSVTATGSPAPTFSITVGSLPSGVTLTSGGLLSGTPTATGTFPVTIQASNIVANVTQSFTLTVSGGQVAAQITASPSSQVAAVGQNVFFTGAASGTPAPTLQWQRQQANSFGFFNLTEGAPYSGTTTGTLTITSVTGSMSGDQFQLVATNSGGSATSSPATLAINLAAPSFTLNPANTTVAIGGSGSFTATAIGNPQPTVRWQRNPSGGGGFSDLIDDGTYSGTTTTTLTISNATVAMNGDQFQLVATNSQGSAPSAAATLTVNSTAPVFTLQPIAAIANLGGNASFTANATGVPTPTFRWQRQPSGTTGYVDLTDDGTYSGTTSTTLTITGATAGMSGDLIRMVATNAAGSLPSNAVTLTVNLGTTISTFAGVATVSGAIDGTGAGARFNSPAAIVVDTAGNFYIADTANSVIRKMTAGGVVTTVAGLAGSRGAVDGTGSAARFNSPGGLAVDTFGNIYVADTFNHTIRVINASGAVTTLAGTPSTSGTADGVGAAARFFLPSGVALEPSGTLVVADSSNHTIRRISITTGFVSTYAGVANTPGLVDSVTPTSARFNAPNAIISDASGNLYVADSQNNAIRKISSTGVVTTIAGSPTGGVGSADGNGAAATFFRPSGIALDASNNLYVADTINSTIRKITPTGDVTTVAGLASVTGSTDGLGAVARFNRPFGVVVDANGNLYVADTGNHTIRRSGSTTAPQIITQPLNAGVALGANATFTVAATGTPAPSSYQWQQQIAGVGDFVNLAASLTYAGVTSQTLTVTGVSLAMAGDRFRVVVANGVAPVAISEPATLSVGTPPAFTSPAAASFRAGQANTFTVTADSTTTVTFTATGLPGWLSLNPSTGVLSGNPPDTTGSPLAFVITANNGVTATQSFVLTLLPANIPPSVATQPASQTIDPGQSVTFSVTAAGTPPFAYQWRRNGIPLAGSTNPTLILTGVQAAGAGTYTVAITNAFGTAISSGATLTVNQLPIIAESPRPVVVLAGGSATFAVRATGGSSFTYQWRKNGVAILGATGSTLTITGITASDVANYDVIVSNSVGSVGSSLAQLTLASAPAAPVITAQPAARTALLGTAVAFTVATTGAPTPTLQWRKNGSPIAGANGTTFAVSAVSAGDAGNYDVVATNSAGTVTSNPAGLTVITRSYAGDYFGTFSGSLGSFALHVREDNSAVFLGYLPGGPAPVMNLRISVSDSGQFFFSQAAVGALAPVNVTGSIASDGSLSGAISGGASATLSGTLAPAAGPTQGFAGFYQAGSPTNAVTAYAIAGPNSQAFAVVLGVGTASDGGLGTLTSSGQIGIVTSRSTINLNIVGSTGLVTGNATGVVATATLSGGSELALSRQRLLNISSRARVGAADAVAIAGFVISGEESKPVLIRAVGPTLGAAPFGLTGALASPRLELFRGNTSLGINTGIAGNRAAIDAAGVQAGAFALGAAGNDAAILTTLAPGNYTAIVSSTTTAAGVALIEVYDLSAPAPGQKLLNISTRASAGVAENVLIAGFVVPAGSSKRVLVRGVGPGLAQFGLTGVLAQPVLTLFNGSTSVASNTNWSTSPDAAAITAGSAQVGAFGLSNNDSAVVLTLAPGNYTAQVTGVANGTGIALIEVYELP